MSFAGQVKCIYIDPPYNTGNRDFVYNDRFVDREDSWRHSKWCEFMYQRLLLARDLYTQDGAIVVSIDDNEVFSLGLLMKRVFGKSAFVANCIWQKRNSRYNNSAIGDSHEYLLVFARNADEFKKTRNRLPVDDRTLKAFKNPNKHPRGPWNTVSFNATGLRPNQQYMIVAPNGKEHYPPEGRHWATLEPEFKRLSAEGHIYWGSDGTGVPRVIRFLDEVNGLVPWTWWPHEEVGHTGEAVQEIKHWLGRQTAFSTPKPVRLIERVLRITCGPNDLVLEFFAGSGTTGHAATKLNTEDGGTRRFILVSNTEATADEPEKNLCRDVCAERVRRVMNGYKNADGETVPGLGGDFAYLRTRRIPVGSLLEIEHSQVWTALQLAHRDTLMPFTEAPYLWAGDENEAICYVPRFRKADAPALRKAVQASTAVTLYSWQPQFVRQHVPAPHVTHLPIPETLALRFGIHKGGNR